MAQRRMIAKSISTSRKVNSLSNEATILYTWIIPHTDDYGRMDGDPKMVRAVVVPLRDYDVELVEKCLLEMEQNDLIKRYEVNGIKYLEITRFGDFQTFKKDRERVSLYPKPKWKEKVSTRKPEDSIVLSKLSEVKLSQVNSVDSTHTLIVELIEAFRELNPSYKDWFKNKTERASCQWLIDTYGLEKSKNMVGYLPKLNSTPYAPISTTPYELKKNIPKIKAFLEKEKATKNLKPIFI